MIPRAVELDNLISSHIEYSRTYVNHVGNFQGSYVEVTTFFMLNGEKRRLDFAWPLELYDVLSNDEILAQVRRARALVR